MSGICFISFTRKNRDKCFNSNLHIVARESFGVDAVWSLRAARDCLVMDARGVECHQWSQIIENTVEPSSDSRLLRN